jgi:hypothetical protein
MLRGLVLVAASVLVLLHAGAWTAAAWLFWQRATWHVPRLQSAILIALAIVVVRASIVPRRWRRLVVAGALVIAGIAFVALPLPKQFEGHALMSGGTGIAASRRSFTERFAVSRGDVSFHSHLSDIVMSSLDRAFGRNDRSPARAYSAFSRLLGLLFLIELLVACAWHRWSRQVCRYAGLALAVPVTLLFFGYWELGYASATVGVVPLLFVSRGRETTRREAATLTAGALQGLHTAGHGFGMVGLAGGALAALGLGRDSWSRRTLRATTFTSSALAWYLGWIFLYVTVAGLSIVWARQLGYRPLVEPMVFDKRIANPLLSLEGFGEFGLFSLLAGVPLLALAMLTSRRALVLSAALFSLPALIFLVRWWPVSAPYNLDLLLSVFPGVFAALWALASSRRQSMVGLVLLAATHLMLWTTLGSGMFERVWIDGSR